MTTADDGAKPNDRQLEAELAAALAERTRLWEELHLRKAQKLEVEHLRWLHAELTGSVSWRVTKPLRGAKAMVARVRWLLGRAREKLAGDTSS